MNRIYRPSQTIKPISVGGESEGFYTLEKIKCGRDGEPVESTARVVAEFPNLITNSGLLYMGSATDYLNGVFVGSGSSVPNFNNTQLDNLVAGLTAGGGTDDGAQSSAPYYARSRKTWTFAVGAAAGNLSEVGVGNAATNLFSRALILDSLGNPTTLTILPDEQLRVTYEHRFYAITTDVTGTFELTGNLGGAYSFVGRAAAVTSSASSSGWLAREACIWKGGNNGLNYAAYNGSIGRITGGPSGEVSSPSGSGSPTGIQDGLSVTHAMNFGISEGNLTGGIRSIRKKQGIGVYQYEITPPIPKTAEDILELQFSHSWGRR